MGSYGQMEIDLRQIAGMLIRLDEGAYPPYATHHWLLALPQGLAAFLSEAHHPVVLRTAPSKWLSKVAAVRALFPRAVHSLATAFIGAAEDWRFGVHQLSM